MSIYRQVQKQGKEAGCPVAGWRIEGILGYFLADTRKRWAGDCGSSVFVLL